MILIFGLLIDGCITTPGLKEPIVIVCSVLTPDEADCTINGDPATAQTKTIIDLIGWQCVSPQGEADLMNHHDALHFELNKKKGK